MEQQNLNEIVGSRIMENEVNSNTQPQKQPDQPVTEDTPQIIDPPHNPSNDNTTIKQMREQIATNKREADNYKALLQRIADEQGISIEQLDESLKSKQDKKKAEQMQIPPEIATQLRTQEERIKELENNNLKIDFNNRVEKFMNTTKLDYNATVEFLKNAQAKGFNPIQPGIDLVTIYRAINFDSIVENAKTEIRQQILSEMKQNPGGNIPNVQQQPRVNTTDQMSDKDFITSLKDLIKK